MRRRDFIAGISGSAAAWPLLARAQQRIPRVGILRNGSTVLPHDLDIVHELAGIGYVAGGNITYDVRAASGDSGLLPQIAQELVATKPDVIVGAATEVAVALLAATRTIPIVLTVIGDPIALGLTESISRPTHNVTGFTISSLSLAAKRIELLHKTVPALRKVAYLWVPGNPLATFFETRVREAAEKIGITLVSLPLASGADIAPALRRAENERVKAVLVEADALTLRFGGMIIDECLVRNLPGMHTWPSEVHNGALMSYGPPEIENNHRAAIYVDRILKGAKVAELPFEEPTEIKLAINLHTARSIGITIPSIIIAIADEVIE